MTGSQAMPAATLAMCHAVRLIRLSGCATEVVPHEPVCGTQHVHWCLQTKLSILMEHAALV